MTAVLSTEDIRPHLRPKTAILTFSFIARQVFLLAYSYFQTSFPYVLYKINETLISHFPTIQTPTWHPLISSKTRHWLAWTTSLVNMTHVFMHRKTPTDSCQSLSQIDSCVTTLHKYIISTHPTLNQSLQKLNNLHNAVSTGYYFVARGVADGYIIMVWRQKRPTLLCRQFMLELQTLTCSCRLHQNPSTGVLVRWH